MKYLIILFILLLVTALIVRRLRPYFLIARQIRDTLNQAREISASQSQGFGSVPRATDASRETLVRCQTCGTWTPASRTVNQEFCSPQCVKHKTGSASDF